MIYNLSNAINIDGTIKSYIHQITIMILNGIVIVSED